MSCAHQGVGEVKQHVGRKEYERMVKALKENGKIYYQKKNRPVWLNGSELSGCGFKSR